MKRSINYTQWHAFNTRNIVNYILWITLTFYLDIQKMLMKPEVKELLISWGKPHKPAASETVSRWIKNELSRAGANIRLYKAHKGYVKVI